MANTIDDVGHRAVGDEGLGAVDAVAVAVALGARAQREGVGARAGLGHRVHADQRAVAQAGQVAPLLLLAAVLPDRHHAGQQVRAEREHEAAVAAAVAQRLEGDRAWRAGRARCRRTPPAPAGPGCPSRRTCATARARTPARGRARRRPAFSSSRANRTIVVAQQLLLVGEREIHRAQPSRPSAAGSRSCRSRSWAARRATRTRRGPCRAGRCSAQKRFSSMSDGRLPSRQLRNAVIRTPALLVGQRDDRRLLDRRVAVEAGLDLAQLDAVAAPLDHPVAPAEDRCSCRPASSTTMSPVRYQRAPAPSIEEGPRASARAGSSSPASRRAR